MPCIRLKIRFSAYTYDLIGSTALSGRPLSNYRLLSKMAHSGESISQQFLSFCKLWCVDLIAMNRLLSLY
jgi:hypothetical protein